MDAWDQILRAGKECEDWALSTRCGTNQVLMTALFPHAVVSLLAPPRVLVLPARRWAPHQGGASPASAHSLAVSVGSGVFARHNSPNCVEGVGEDDLSSRSWRATATTTATTTARAGDGKDIREVNVEAHAIKLWRAGCPCKHADRSVDVE
jgi:hypothetical protein